MKTDKQMVMVVAKFAERWKRKEYERSESHPFWIDLLSNVLGIETPFNGYIQLHVNRKKFILI